MKKFGYRNCSHLDEVLEMGDRSSISESLSDHIESCPACASARSVDQFMRRAVQDQQNLTQLPDPALIWWKGLNLAKESQVARATMPIRILERVALMVGAVGAASGLMLVWPAVRSGVVTWLSSMAAGVHTTAGASPVSQILLFGTAVLAVVAYGLFSQWAED